MLQRGVLVTFLVSSRNHLRWNGCGQVLHNGELVCDGVVKALKAAPVKQLDAQPEEATREVRTPPCQWCTSQPFAMYIKCYTDKETALLTNQRACSATS